MDYKITMEKLQKPFRVDEIEWRVGSTNSDKTKGLALAYVTNRAIQNRLDDVFGIFGWKNEYREWKGKSQICGISVWFEDRNEWITKWDGADDSNMDATKGGLSDAMKRCASQWGIGRYLYKLPQVWCELQSFGRSYKLKSKPNLPKWAVPKELTDTQIKLIYDIAEKSGYEKSEVDAIVKKKYGVEDTDRVNEDQFEEICKGFESNPKNQEKNKKSS